MTSNRFGQSRQGFPAHPSNQSRDPESCWWWVKSTVSLVQSPHIWFVEIHWNPLKSYNPSFTFQWKSLNRFLFAETWYLRTSPRSWCPWGEGFEGRGKHSDLHCRSYKANGLTFRGAWGTPSNASGCKKQDCDLMGFFYNRNKTKQNLY
jgi:hypothetical protein